ncbi:MAG TPA: hypothetical protein VKY37_12650 [Brumimicrobium sp.]|nr:hypothetical protein [Brumimicrobium sp.]
MRNKTREHIKKEIEKLKQLKAKVNRKMTVARLKTMKGFQHLPDKLAKEVLAQLREYATIVLLYINHIESKKGKSDE